MHGPLMAPVWEVAQFQPTAEQLPKIEVDHDMEAKQRGHKEGS